jgi:outer membrane receptor protein involved in Fe transport
MKQSLLFFALLFIGQFAQAQKPSVDTLSQIELKEIIVTASRAKESVMQAPVSIEKMDVQDIRRSARFSFFDAIENLKGIQMITPSMGFRVINARGFTNTTNVRFVQMVDGVDNQAPHIGAPIANAMGPTDLDILKVEVIPGSASAVYGMNAINGIANFITKNSFDYQGLSLAQKTGVNHVGDSQIGAQVFSETNIRYAKVFNKKWAFKINGAYSQGTDWYANNLTDLNPNANISTNLTGEQNVGKDLVNNYGDESANRRTVTLGGKQYVVSRTGYAEKEVADYGLKNWKGDVSLHYRPTNKIELTYTYRFANLNTIYQRTNRFRFDNYLTQQHLVSLKSNSIQFKAYLTTENTGNSYNIRSMAENIDRSFKTDDQWFKDFGIQYNKSLNAGQLVPTAMSDARNFADLGRPNPNSETFNQLITKLRDVNNWDIGAALRVRAKLYHAEIQHNITETLLANFKEKYRIDLMYGLDFRNYEIVPDGNYFVNPSSTTSNLNYSKLGGFVQATKYMLGRKIKLNAVLRIDKNQYFAPQFNPRLALVYSPTPVHNFRVAVQNGYRFPSIFEAFSNINSGGVKRVGGLAIMSNGIFENSYLRSSIDEFQAAVTNDVNKNGLTATNAITKNQSLLKKNNYTYLQPEQVGSIEIGYRTKVLNGRLNLDVDFYYNIYRNLMAQVEANIPKISQIDSIAFYLNDKRKQDKYRLWTNSKTVSYNYGATIGLAYQLPKQWIVSGNLTLNKLDRKDQKDGLEDGFNTPDWIYNVSVGNVSVYQNLGFNLNYRKQAAFLWQSALATGEVSSYATLDAQLSYGFQKNKALLKIGANNALNTYYYSFVGGPSVGGFYYVTLSLEM